MKSGPLFDLSVEQVSFRGKCMFFPENSKCLVIRIS